MREAAQPRRIRSDSIMNYRHVGFLLATALFEQITLSVVRVTTSYRAVELGLSPIWLGVITAAFAILPMVFAVPVGRFIDRGNDARTAWFGSALLLASCAGFTLAAWQIPLLLLFTALLGISHLMLVISQQVLCTRYGGKGAMDRLLGNYLVANAMGQGVGPFIIGWAGGDAKVPPTDFLFAIGVAAAVLMLVTALTLRSGEAPTAQAERRKPVPVREILRLPGLYAIFFVSVVTVAAQDLIVVYMPLLGAERGMTVDTVGWLLTVRAACSMFARFFYAQLYLMMGRRTLMIVSVLASAIVYAGVALPLPLSAMYVVVGGSGFALGVAVTVSIASLLDLADVDTRGTTNSLRMMGNRVGQFTIPFIAGTIAVAAGVGGIFIVIGVSLAAAALAVRLAPYRPEA